VVLTDSELLLEFLKTRRSIRHFSSDPVPPELVERVLATAIWAPSAHNAQPWRFVRLVSAESRQKFVSAMSDTFFHQLQADGMDPQDITRRIEGSQQRILNAPVVILLCLDSGRGTSYPDPTRQQAEHLLGVQSVALVGGTLLLAAHACGLGGLWMAAPLFAQQVARTSLDLPPDWEPQALILLGFPESVPPPPSRLPLSSLVYDR
jgi:F420 biosynthesis protein FbiB-like protein